jgi:DNA polymerase-3 subunit epsilon
MNIYWPSRWQLPWRERLAVNEDRWIMLDVETSGLDTRRDSLLAIAAIGMQVNWSRKTLSIALADSFEVVLQQDAASSKGNILIHGIGAQAQRAGMAPAQALHAFSQFAGNSPLLAFHAAFDQAMIGRHARQHLGAALPNPWLDIDHLCAVTFESVRARALDDWMHHFGIECAVRHQAAADTLAECELLQRIWPKVAAQCSQWRDVQRLAAQHRWLARSD